MHRLCVVTGSRSDYGLLRPVMRAIASDPDCLLQVVATGAHLSAVHGGSAALIEQDGFRIDHRATCLGEGDDGAAVAQAMGRALQQIGSAYATLAPKWVVLLGDRYEILAAAAAALVMGVPMAHIAGGDVTEGAYDDAIRHSITKLATMHFATNADAARRLHQLGEPPDRIVLSGSPGIDTVLTFVRIGRDEVERRTGIRLAKHNALITFHPVTRALIPGEQQLQALFDALSGLGGDWRFIFTGVNADNDHQRLRNMIREFVARDARGTVFENLGSELYLNLMALATVVVGNSSSGLYEAPSFKLPTINIGERQKGRPRAASVIDCDPDHLAITSAFDRALGLDCSGVVNPYGDGHAASMIVQKLKSISDPQALLRKPFHDL